MLHLPATVQVGPPLKWEVEHAILGSVIFHPTWAVAEWWSTLILPVCDPPQPVCGHYNDAPSYFHCLAMKSAPSFSHMGGGWPIYDAKSLIFYALNILLGVKAVVAKLDVGLVMTLEIFELHLRNNRIMSPGTRKNKHGVGSLPE